MNVNAPIANLADGGDFAGELLERRRRRRVPRMTIVLASLVVLGGVFAGGVEAQKLMAGPSTSSAAGSAFAQARAAGLRSGGAGFARPGAGGFGGGNATTGTVTLIKGTTLYVTDSTGNTVLVKTSASSQVTKSVTTTVKAIRPGDTVTFVGTQQSDGSYTPSSITLSSASNG